MEQNDDFASDAFYNDASLQQLDESINAAVNVDPLNDTSAATSLDAFERLTALGLGRGLNQVAWSRLGQLAGVSEDGRKINIQCLRFDPFNHRWSLSPDNEQDVGLGKLVHLVWSPIATDLAVVDIDGRISILRSRAHLEGAAANQLTVAHSGAKDDPGELGQLIGLHWLSQEPPKRHRLAVQYAAKNPTTGAWEHRQAQATPFPPSYQRAIITITRGGTLSLVYEMLPSMAFGKVSIPIPTRFGLPFNHSACASTSSGKILIALQCHDGTISAYLLNVDIPTLKSGLNSAPTLSLETVASSLPMLSPTIPDNQLYDQASYQLMHLGIVPTTDVEGVPQAPPTVYGVYSVVNAGLDSLAAGYHASSIIRRWSFDRIEQTLHPKFGEIPSKMTNTNSTQMTTSVRQLPEKQEQTIVSVLQVDSVQSIAVTSIDGRTDFLNTEDLAPLSYAASTHEVSSLPQSGFTLPLTPIAESTALCSNACILAISSKPGNERTIATMDYPILPNTDLNPTTNPQIDTALAAITLSVTRAWFLGSNIDDLLALTMHSLPSALAEPLITSMYRLNTQDSDFPNERLGNLEKAVQKQILPKVFSFHYAVSFLTIKDLPPDVGRPKTTLAGQWAWLAMNLRFVAQLIYQCINEVKGTDAKPSQALVDIVCGNIRWSTDLLRWMIAQILEVGDRETNPDLFGDPSPGSTADGSQGLTSLLLNCNWTRSFLVAIVRALRGLTKLPEPRSVALQQIVGTIAEQVAKGVGLLVMEGLLSVNWSGPAETVGDGAGGGETGARPAPLSEKEIARMQLEMMVTGVVVGEYRWTVSRCLRKFFNGPSGVKEKGGAMLDRLTMFTDRVDMGWLMLDSEWEGKGGGRNGRKKMLWDVHKKKAIYQGVKDIHGDERRYLKKCVRCGRYSESINGVKEFSRILATGMMRCICDGQWIVERW